MTDARRLQLITPWAVTLGLFVVWERRLLAVWRRALRAAAAHLGFQDDV